MTVEELMNFLQGIQSHLNVVVREDGVLVEAYYEYLTDEDPGGPAVLIKRKYPNE